MTILKSQKLQLLVYLEYSLCLLIVVSGSIRSFCVRKNKAMHKVISRKKKSNALELLLYVHTLPL